VKINPVLAKPRTRIDGSARKGGKKKVRGQIALLAGLILTVL